MQSDHTSVPASSPSNADDIGAVLFFLRFAAQEGTMFNMTTGRQAFDAFARLLGQDPDDLWMRTASR